MVLLVSMSAAPVLGGSLVRGPYVQMPSPNAVTIRWRTFLPTDSRVRYGADPASLSEVVSDSQLTTEHELRLQGLVPGVRYFYAVGTSSGDLVSGPEVYVDTPPPIDAASASRVWVVGDSGTADASAEAVLAGYRAFAGAAEADLMLMLGDNAYPDGTDAQYQAAVFDLYGDVLRHTPVWSCLGNHDGHSADSASQTGPYYDIFTLPTAAESGGTASGTEAYYSFDHGAVHFVVLDSYDSDRAVDGPMLTWLDADLQATTASWIVAFWHHPPYTKGSHDSDSETRLREMRENVLPVLEDYGVDLVLTGHSHSYERSYLLDGHYGLSSELLVSMVLDAGDGDPAGSGAYAKPVGLAAHEGAVYVVAGSSGRVGGGSFDHAAMHVSLPRLGSLLLDIDGTVLTGRFLGVEGTVVDRFQIRKGALACTPQPGVTFETRCVDGVDDDCDGLVDLADGDCAAPLFTDGFESGDLYRWSGVDGAAGLKFEAAPASVGTQMPE